MGRAPAPPGPVYRIRRGQERQGRKRRPGEKGDGHSAYRYDAQGRRLSCDAAGNGGQATFPEAKDGARFLALPAEGRTLRIPLLPPPPPRFPRKGPPKIAGHGAGAPLIIR